MRRSLEVKCLFFFSLALLLVISFSFVLYFRMTKNQLSTQNPLMGRLLSEREFLLIHLRVLLRGESGGTVLSSEEEFNLNEFIDSMTAQSEEITRPVGDRPFELRLIRVRGHRHDEDDAPRDAYEKDLIQRFSAHRSASDSQVEAAERTDALGRYYYYQPLYLERSCLNCHQDVRRTLPMPLGSLQGVIQATIFEPPARDEITRLWSMLLAAAIVTAFFGLIAFYVVIRYVVIKPLRSLRDVTEAISRGNITKRAELHTGDEFESLSIAFNRMLRHLVTTQDKLRGSNAELEVKVDELANRSLELFEMNKVKSDFMATMSHELRTPLNSILGFSEVLGSISVLNEKQKRYVQNINESGHTLLTMINDILDMARLESGRLEVVPSSFRVELIVDAQIDMARPLADRKNIELISQIEPNLTPLYQDESRLQQILNNLLSNAIKFTPEGGKITVGVRRVDWIPPVKEAVPDEEITRFAEAGDEKGLELRVQDSGVGIAESDLTVIFDKFRQAGGKRERDTITRQYGGSGLGLSIVKELCRLLGGDITVESRLGYGSTFIVLVPWQLKAPTLNPSPMMNDIQEFSRAGQLPRPVGRSHEKKEEQKGE